MEGIVGTPAWPWRVAAAVILIAAGTLDHAAAAHVAELYALAVVCAALGDGWRGGLLAGGVSAALLATTPDLYSITYRATGAVVLTGIGLLAGAVLQNEIRQRQHLQRTAEQLSSVYEKVQANFEGMKRAERLSAIGQLSAGLAHEIRNPLASIAGAASILQRNDNLEPKYRKCVEIIAHECERLNGLLTNFLNFARPRAPRMQVVQVNTVLENVLGLANHGVRGKAVHCEARVAEELPAVECDPEQLEQVLLNLMINAIEASPDGETVTISAAAENGNVAVRVTDHGHGVAPAHVDRLFDPFFTTKEHGTGLGLPVAHQIMAQMGGALVAEQRSGNGMTFSVLLPAKDGTA